MTEKNRKKYKIVEILLNQFLLLRKFSVCLKIWTHCAYFIWPLGFFIGPACLSRHLVARRENEWRPIWSHLATPDFHHARNSSTLANICAWIIRSTIQNRSLVFVKLYVYLWKTVFNRIIFTKWYIIFCFDLC